jgi:cation:H+ antiporter
MIFFTLKCIVGLGILSVAAEFLVRSSVSISKALHISPLIIGLTVVAFGTSAPELAVSALAALKGQGDIAMGNVVGSNVFNLLVIVGLSALFRPILIHQQLMRFDLPVMAVITLIVAGMSYTGNLGGLEGSLLLVGLALYIGIQIYLSRRTPDPEVDLNLEEIPAKNLWVVSGIWALSLIALIFGSRWFVEGASGLALAFGVSEVIVGLTLVAFGTSLPEVATSVTAALKGQGDLAIGNAVGSNIFNILGVLGVSALIAPNGLTVAPEILSRDLPVLLATSLMVFPLFWSCRRLDRWEGGILVGAYFVYTLLLYFSTQLSVENYQQTEMAMIALGLPALVLFLFVHAYFGKKAA